MATTKRPDVTRSAVVRDVIAILLDATPMEGLAVSHTEGRWDLIDPDQDQVVASFARPEDLDLFARAPAALRILTTALAEVRLAHRGPAGGTCPTDGQPVPCSTTRLLAAHLDELEASGDRPDR
ncbi:MAG: hypothetical protein HYR62_01820 [Actinobacteria bacterium]|nr:hypothetical protein [Actinomycetota bacterium]MBI3687220.1 hypothetical protein [Actinomycetota bacterium]